MVTVDALQPLQLSLVLDGGRQNPLPERGIAALVATHPCLFERVGAGAFESVGMRPDAITMAKTDYAMSSGVSRHDPVASSGCPPPQCSLGAPESSEISACRLFSALLNREFGPRSVDERR